MKKVAIVTDSSATVPKELVRDLGVRVVPVYLVIANRTYRDGIDITPDEVYRLLRNGSAIPTSTAPSVGDFLHAYLDAAADASAILSIHMSPLLSSTYSVALTASQLPNGVPIRVLNCRTAAMGQGFVVLEAARLAATGASLDEVVARAEEVAEKVRLLFILDTFEYLRRGGRIGGAAALAGTLLQIRPLMCVRERVEVLAKPRTKPKVIECMLKQMEADLGGQIAHAAVLHADAPREAEELKERVAARIRCAELYVTEFTPVMGAHTGPGLLGVAFYAE